MFGSAFCTRTSQVEAMALNFQNLEGIMNCRWGLGSRSTSTSTRFKPVESPVIQCDVLMHAGSF